MTSTTVQTTSFVQAYRANIQPRVYDLTEDVVFLCLLIAILLRCRSKKLIGKKEGEPEELTHLTEGSFEDATITVSFGHNLSPETKKVSLLLAHLQCSALTSCVR